MTTKQIVIPYDFASEVNAKNVFERERSPLLYFCDIFMLYKVFSEMICKEYQLQYVDISLYGDYHY